MGSVSEYQVGRETPQELARTTLSRALAHDQTTHPRTFTACVDVILSRRRARAQSLCGSHVTVPSAPVPKVPARLLAPLNPWRFRRAVRSAAQLPSTRCAAAARFVSAWESDAEDLIIRA